MKTVMICIKQRYGSNPSCAGRGSVQLAEMLDAMIASESLPLKTRRFPCLGLCALGPNVKIVGGGLFHHVQATDLPAIVQLALND